MHYGEQGYALEAMMALAAAPPTRPRSKARKRKGGSKGVANRPPVTDDNPQARAHYRACRTALSGALGGGLLAAGFGPWFAAGGMLVGGAAGYLVERRLQELNRKRPA